MTKHRYLLLAAARRPAEIAASPRSTPLHLVLDPASPVFFVGE